MCGWRVCLDAAARADSTPCRLCFCAEKMALLAGRAPWARMFVLRTGFLAPGHRGRFPQHSVETGPKSPQPFWLKCAKAARGLRMQTLARQAIAELAKGVSTGLVVWAGAAPCTPTLVCSSCALCPDCHCSCHDGVRAPRLADADCGGFSLGWLVAALAGGVVIGLVLAAGLRHRSEFEAAPRRSPCAPPKAGKGVVRQLD